MAASIRPTKAADIEAGGRAVNLTTPIGRHCGRKVLWFDVTQAPSLTDKSCRIPGVSWLLPAVAQMRRR
jgi:hypothetical protein